jgi:DNA-binding transcriptional ArsR family regulator
MRHTVIVLRHVADAITFRCGLKLPASVSGSVVEMIRLRVGSTGVMHLRFGIAPVHEVIGAARVVRHPARYPLHAAWWRRYAARAASLDIKPLLALLPQPGKYFPDFLDQPPAEGRTTFAEDLALVRRTPLRRVREELQISRREMPGSRYRAELCADPKRARSTLADCLEQIWEHLVEPVWPSLQAVLEADIMYRDQRATSGRLAALVEDLHPDIALQDDVLQVRATQHADLDCRSSGVLLVPTVFNDGRLGKVINRPWQPTLYYPARATGMLWSGPQTSTTSGLARLIGSRRTEVLIAAADAATTTAIAATVGVPISSASEHLAALRAAGLVRSTRQGRRVLHVRTRLGEALLSANLHSEL